MSYDFGIYFGGCSMVIAYCRDGKNDVIVNESGDRTTPAALSITNNEFSIGLSVKQNLIRNAENSILYAKYFIGKNSLDSDPDLTKILQKTYCKVKLNEKTNEVLFDIEKNDDIVSLTLKSVIERQLKYLNDLAKSSLSLKDNLNAVLSVPCYFNNDQISILIECATKVGFNVHRIIKNPLAACLAYDIEEDNMKISKLLVYQMGSSSLEITLIDLVNGLYRKIDSIYTFEIGGDHFTDVIVNVLVEEFKRKNKNLDPRDHKRSLFKLKSNAEYLKHILSTIERAHCSIDALYEGIDLDYYLTRQRFEGASGNLFDNCLKPIDELLAKNNVKIEQIDQVILAGAATKMCRLQNLIKEKFPDQTQILNQLSPDEVIALGCAKQSYILTNSKYKKFNQGDNQFQCLADEVVLKIGDENSENITQIFALYSPIPIKRRLNINLEENQPFILYIYEKKNNKLLTKIDLTQFTSKELSGLFQIKLDGTFEISITEISTNQTVTVYLNSES